MLVLDHRKLAAMRKKRGLTQDQLAERACCETIDYTTWETGALIPSKWWVKRLAAALQCEVHNLLSPQHELNEKACESANSSQAKNK